MKIGRPLKYVTVDCPHIDLPEDMSLAEKLNTLAEHAELDTTADLPWHYVIDRDGLHAEPRCLKRAWDGGGAEWAEDAALSVMVCVIGGVDGDLTTPWYQIVTDKQIQTLDEILDDVRAQHEYDCRIIPIGQLDESQRPGFDVAARPERPIDPEI